MILRSYLERNKKLTDRALRSYLLPADSYAPMFHRAIKYSLFPGGKRLRPLLAIAAYRACSGEGRKILPFACALEMLHTSFLIHDDLPALDNDAYRRGRLTVHKKFGEATAILAGDGLLILAFSVISKGKDFGLAIRVIREISRAIGSKGVIVGQAADMENRSRENRLVPEGRKRACLRSKEADLLPNEGNRILEYIHTHKTGALIKAAVTVGGIVAAADKKKIDALTKFGRDFGFCFQVVDDILDNDGYSKILGREGAKEKAAFLTRQAIRHLECFGRKADRLRELANFCLNRK